MPARTDPKYFSSRSPTATAAAIAVLCKRLLHEDPHQLLRKKLWRDEGQCVVVVESIRECLRHAGSGGLHAAVLAFAFRAVANSVLALIRIRAIPRKQWFSTVWYAIFGAGSLRFSAMFGTFTAMYKLILNALPLLIPSSAPISPVTTAPPTGTTTPTAITSAQALLQPLSLSQPPLVVIKKTRRWHAALAGFVAGALAVMCEERGKRGLIAQQVFVRGLQGSYNAFTTKRGIDAPHGEILLFSLACGQIMYAFMLRKDTIPKAYDSWIRHMSGAPAAALRLNRDLVRGNGKAFQTSDLDILLSDRDIHPANATILQNIRRTAVPFLFPSPSSPNTTTPSYSSSVWTRPHMPCAALHPSIPTCTAIPLNRFLRGFTMMLPVYGLLHVVPAVLYKRNLLMNLIKSGGKGELKEVVKMMVKAGLGTARSSAFLGVFIVIYHSSLCYKHHLYDLLTRKSVTTAPSSVRRLLIALLASRLAFWIPGFLTGLSLFVEAKRRRGELAVYVLPKALESVWKIAKGRGLVCDGGRWGDVLLTAVGMSMVMGTYQNEPRHLSGLVRRVVYQFVGPN